MKNCPVIHFSLVILLILQILNRSCSSTQKTNESCNSTQNTNESVVHKHVSKVVSSFPEKKFEDTNLRVYGRVAIVETCLNNKTLSPYLCSQAALGCGAKTTYIFSTQKSIKFITALRNESKDVILLPYLDEPDGHTLMDKYLQDMDSVIFGNGLSRNDHNLTRMLFLIEQLKSNTHPPLIFDSDSIKFVCRYKRMLSDYKGEVYLTPNAKEFQWLKEAFPYNGPKQQTKSTRDDPEHLKQIASTISPKATIILKGPVDKIITSESVMTCDLDGTNQRIRGQGDLLAGTLAQFSLMSDDFGKKKPVSKAKSSSVHDFSKVLTGYTACAVNRMACQVGFRVHGPEMMLADMKDHFRFALKKSVSDDSKET